VKGCRTEGYWQKDRKEVSLPAMSGIYICALEMAQVVELVDQAPVEVVVIKILRASL